MDSIQQWTLLARILRPQGRRGEVLAELFTDFPERFAVHPRVWLAPAGFTEAAQPPDPSLPQPAAVTGHWLPVGRNAGRVVLHLAGVDSIAQAEALAGREVVVPLEERLPLEPDAAYVSDLVGATVFDRGTAIGVVEDVEFPVTPDGSRRLDEAAPLLAVAAPDGGQLLIPFARAYLVELDIAGKAIRMALPEGLTEINRKAARRQGSEAASQRE